VTAGFGRCREKVVENGNAERRRQAVASNLTKSDLDDVMQRVTLEDADDGISHIDHQHAEAAVLFIRTATSGVTRLARAGDWGELAIDQADDIGDDDLFRRLCNEVAAELSALGFDVTRAAELQQDLLDELERQTFGLREFGYADELAAQFMGNAEPDQSTKRVFAAFGELHGCFLLHECTLGKWSLKDFSGLPANGGSVAASRMIQTTFIGGHRPPLQAAREISLFCEQAMPYLRGMSRVVTFGEIMLRLNTPGHERFSQATHFEVTYGGAEANVAVALAQLGETSAFISKLPPNELGQRASDELRRHGVDVASMVRGGERLGLYFVEHGASQRASRVLYDRANSAFSEADPAEFPWPKLLHGADWLHWSGITPALSGNCARITAEALAAAKGARMIVSFDMNYRAKLWSPEDASKTLVPLMHHVDVCICGSGEASAIFGVDAANEEDLAEALAEEFGFKTVMIPQRKAAAADSTEFGGLLLTKGKIYRSARHHITIVDRVGAGDAMTGGLIFALLREMEPQQAINFAVAAGVLKHTVPGDFALFSLGEVEALASGRDGGRIQR
jgi:2-dehydro-3-deoxygluconokinase